MDNVSGIHPIASPFRPIDFALQDRTKLFGQSYDLFSVCHPAVGLPTLIEANVKANVSGRISRPSECEAVLWLLGVSATAASLDWVWLLCQFAGWPPGTLAVGLHPGVWIS